MDTILNTAINIEVCKSDIFVICKKIKLIIIVEIGITSENQSIEIEIEKSVNTTFSRIE